MPLCICCGEEGSDYCGIIICEECLNTRSHIEEVAQHIAFINFPNNPARITHYHTVISTVWDELFNWLMQDHGITDISDNNKEIMEEIIIQWNKEHSWEWEL